MDDASLKQAIKGISGKDLEQRKSWYSPAAEVDDSTRPQLPSELIRQAVKAAQLPSSSLTLETGIGPGAASFAELGCPMV